MEVEIEQFKARASTLIGLVKPTYGNLRLSQLREEIVSFESSNHQRQADLIDGWIAELTKVSRISALLRLTVGSKLPNTVPDQTTILGVEDIDNRLGELIEQVRSLSDALVPAEIDQLSSALEVELGAMQQELVALEKDYSDMCKLRSILQRGSDEEFSTRNRIATELDALTAASIKIAEEASFIREERERLKFSLATEFPAPPLNDLLESDLGAGNAAWQKLYNNGSYEKYN